MITAAILTVTGVFAAVAGASSGNFAGTADTEAAGATGSSADFDDSCADTSAQTRIAVASVTDNKGLLVNFAAGDSWSNGGVTYTKWDVSILNNTGSGTGSWSFTVPVTVSGIDNYWNCKLSANGSGLTFASADYNGTIGAGAQITGPGCILKASGSTGKLAGTWLTGASGGTATYLGSGSPADYVSGSSSTGSGTPGSTGSSVGSGQPATSGTGTSVGTTPGTAVSGVAAPVAARQNIKNILTNKKVNASFASMLGTLKFVENPPFAEFGARLIANLKKAFAQAGKGSSAGTGTTVSTAPTGTPLATHGALSVKGTQLVDSKGQPFRLKGVSTHGLAWFPAYVNKDAFRTLRDDWGANLVRLAMYSAEYNGYCTGGDRTQLKSLIDAGVSAATELGMYVIIDWHILSDGDPNIHKADAKAFFAEMAAKYAGHDNVLYEICNEPNGCSWASVRSYANELIPVIRAADPDAVIIVGTPTWSQDVEQVAAAPVTNGTNVMYALHFYAATHGDNIRNKAIQALSAGTPLFVTEFSICDASGNGGIDYNSASAWKDLINKYNLSFAGWSLSNKAETSALISSGCSKTSGWSTSELSDTGRWLRDFCKAS